jgi:NTP pyrophosphatase (non-canonical NTP hydrolase)
LSDSLITLAQALKQFAQARDWGQFHSPKNLASALVVEAGELLEHFQWLTDEQSRNLSEEDRKAVAAEAADVLLYLIQFCDALGSECRKVPGGPCEGLQPEIQQALKIRYTGERR